VDATKVAPVTASEILAEMLERGYSISVRTRREVHEHKVGVHAITYADKLVVRGPEKLPPDVHDAVLVHRDELLAAASVMNPPVGWLEVLIRRHREGRTPLRMLAANVAAFVGLNPAHDGPKLAAIIKEALKAKRGVA
jgi:hypothetical protein